MVIFSDMRGGDHLKDNEAQLTEAELNLYKYQRVYNFPLEQSALTTKTGKILDYNVGDEHSINICSLDLFKKYHGSEIGYENNDISSGNLYRVFKSGVFMHTHPCSIFPYKHEGATITKKFNKISNRYISIPSSSDLYWSISLPPFQDLIISFFGVTAMKPNIKMLMLNKKERYIMAEKIRCCDDFFHNFGDNKFLPKKYKMMRRDVIDSGYCHTKIPRNRGDAMKIGEDKYIEFENLVQDSNIFKFILVSALFGIAVRFIRDINLKTGIGETHEFSTDHLRRIKELHPIDFRYSPYTENKIWDHDDNLILPEWY
jgi:hypothetical protein